MIKEKKITEKALHDPKAYIQKAAKQNIQRELKTPRQESGSGTASPDPCASRKTTKREIL